MSAARVLPMEYLRCSARECHRVGACASPARWRRSARRVADRRSSAGCPAGRRRNVCIAQLRNEMTNEVGICPRDLVEWLGQSSCVAGSFELPNRFRQR
jgi:hypothetical protein